MRYMSMDTRVVKHPAGTRSRRRSLLCVLGCIVALGSCTPSSIGPEDPTPLLRAIDDRDTARVEGLLNQGADPNERGILYPLEVAASGEDVRILELLFAHGASYDRAIDKSNGWSPLFSAARKGRPEAVALLLAAGADPCRRTTVSWARGLRPLELAIREGNLRVVQTLQAAEQTHC